MHVHLAQRFESVADIGEIVAGLACRAAENVQADSIFHIAGILRMVPVDHIADRIGAPPCVAVGIQQMNRKVSFKINVGDQLALAQIGKNLVDPPGVDPKRTAAARPPALESKNQSGTLPGAPVDNA